jgi:hypothetical protein
MDAHPALTGRDGRNDLAVADPVADTQADLPLDHRD